MNKSILVLDDNSVVHSLIASALDLEGLTIHHEFNPQKFVERANSLMPDLILLGNLRQDPKYSICKALKANPSLKQVPLVMMTGSMDDLGSKALETLKIEGVIRKPFEASDLQQQVSKHLNLADLIGSAFEFRQTQSARSDELNPLANLDVLDEEVTGMLLGTGTPTAPKEAELDEAVLSQTLQPEQAFEAISDSEEVVLEAVEEGEFPQQEAPGVEELGAADLLEEEPYPTQSLEDGDFMVMEDHEPALESVSVEELGPGDLLEDEAPEEMVLSPQSFEQNLAKAPPSGRLPSLEEIEVELDGGPEELEFIDQELAADEVDKLDSGLEEVLAEDVVENIPLSVRRMMDRKPLFSLSAEEKKTLHSDDPLSFIPTAEEESLLREQVKSLSAIDLETEETLPEPDMMTAEEEALPVVEESAPPRDSAETTFESGESALSFEEPFEDSPTPVMEDVEVRPVTATLPPMPETPSEETTLFGGEDATEFEGLDAMAEEPIVAELDEEKIFPEEILGNEEIDEEQIIQATASDVEPVPTASFAEEDLRALEMQPPEMLDQGEPAIFEMEGSELEADTAEEAEEITIDQEEEAIIAASVAKDEALTGPFTDALIERNFRSLDEKDQAWARISDVPEDAVELEGVELESVEDFGEDEVLLEEQALELPEESSMGEPGVSLSLEEDSGAPPPPRPLEEAEEDALSVTFGNAEAESESWKPVSPPGFVAKVSEDFPEETIMDPFQGPKEEGSDPTSEVRHSPSEVLEDPDDLLEFPEEGPGEDSAEIWKPSAPPSFVAKAGEEFPPEAASDPFTGPFTEGDSPTPVPRFQSEEVLEDPESMAPILEAHEEDVQDPSAGGDEVLFADIAPEGEQDSIEPPLEDEDSERVNLTDMERDLETVPESTVPGDLSFDDAFASMQADIEAHPEGERLDDILKLEGIRERVKKLELTLPQNESTFSRVFGVYAAQPGDASIFPAALTGEEGAAAVTRPTTAPKPARALEDAGRGAAAQLAATPGSALSLLDAGTREKLSRVLDEIISVSVRRAVQEEMPKLVSKMVKEEERAQ